MNKYEEFDSNREFSSISIENFEFKITPQQVRHISDSFDSSAIVRNESDNSFISQVSGFEDYAHKVSLKPAKSCTPLRQAPSLSRPLSVLKTTFLDDGSPRSSFKYSLPKKLPPDIPRIKGGKKKSESGKESERLEHSFKQVSSREEEGRLSELENQVVKKDALIETLRSRVVKMVEELEETKRKVNLNRASVVEECKVLNLRNRCEDLESQIQSFQSKEKEMNLYLDKKDEEVQILTKELKSMRGELDQANDSCKKLQIDLTHTRQSRESYEKMVENLKMKLDTSSKAIEFSSSHKTHLEQEVVRLEILKRAHENEMNLVMEENSKGLKGLTRKNEELSQEVVKYQKLWNESVKAHEGIQTSNSKLTQRLEHLESQLGKIDKSFRVPLREKQGTSNLNGFDDKVNAKGGEYLCQGCLEVREGKRNREGCGGDSRVFFVKEVFEGLGVDSEDEAIKAIRRLALNGKEKKLIKKVVALVKQCLDKEKNAEISCTQIWRIIKKVFEEYARMVQEYGNEIKVLRQYFGQIGLVDKLIAMSQENKRMKEAMGYF